MLGLLIAALMLAPFGVGSLLPAEYEGRATRSFAVPPEVLWAAATDPVEHPIGGRIVSRVEELAGESGEPALCTWREVMGNTWMDARVVAEDAPRSRTVELRDATEPWVTRWELTVEALPGGSSATVVQTIRIDRGGLQAPLMRWALFLGGADKAPAQFLTLLAMDVTP